MHASLDFADNVPKYPLDMNKLRCRCQTHHEITMMVRTVQILFTPNYFV